MDEHARAVKGGRFLDWGIQNRLARIFNPQTGKTVMLAIDHGYSEGSTPGLRRWIKALFHSSTRWTP